MWGGGLETTPLKGRSNEEYVGIFKTAINCPLARLFTFLPHAQYAHPSLDGPETSLSQYPFRNWGAVVQIRSRGK